MKSITYAMAIGYVLTSAAQAEPILLKNQNNNLSLSIYNQNMALVKDSRMADFKSGGNEIIFDGVAQRIQPETALLFGDDIKVSEQNYNYSLMTYDNFIKQSVGQEVNTVRQNPQTGENIFERAVVIGVTAGRPVLRFSYGIDTDFPGRIVFNRVPSGVSDKPMLAAKINVKNGGNKKLNLAYLTDGLSWKTDYVANVTAPTKLNLTGWVTINNESGLDYENAKIQLVAGEVNVVRSVMARPRMMLAAKSLAFDNSMNDGANIEPETVNSYEIYTLPTITTIKDNQTKQIALLEKANVTYAKELKLSMPFYFGTHTNRSEFTKLHPAITYVMKNTADSNLGISLPAGTIRFYENDKNGNLQFIGSSSINHTAKEDTLHLNLGEAFNVSVSGKITNVNQKELNRQNKEQNGCQSVKYLTVYDVEVTVNNAENNANTILLEQTFPQQYKIVKENFKSEAKNVSLREWKIEANENAKTVLNYTVEVTESKRVCP